MMFTTLGLAPPAHSPLVGEEQDAVELIDVVKSPKSVALPVEAIVK